VHLRGAFVPDADLLAPPGHGLEIAQEGMMFSRLGIAAMAIGGMKRAASLALRYVERRRIRSGGLAGDPTVRQRLRWIDGAIAAGGEILTACAQRLDGGGPLPVAFHLTTKVVVTEWLGQAADWVLQMLGGRGYAEPNEISQLVRDARVLRIFEGPSEALLARLGAEVRKDPTAAWTHLPDGPWATRIAAAKRADAGDVPLGQVAALGLVWAHARSDVAVEFAAQRLAEAESNLAQPTPATADDLVARLAARLGGTVRFERRAAGVDQERDPLLVDAIATTTPSRPRVPSADVGQPAASDGDLVDVLRRALVEVLSRTLGRPVLELPADAQLSASGLDSLAAVELALLLEQRIGQRVSPDLMYQCETLAELAEVLRPRRSGQGDPRLARYRHAIARIEAMRRAGRYPFHAAVQAHDGNHVVVADRRLLMLGSYGYLGLLQHPRLTAAMASAASRFGTGHHGVRLLAGSTEVHVALERRLAEAMRAEDAVTFPSGFVANVATITALVGPGDLVVGDEWNHASIHDGCRASGAAFETYPHGDLDALDRLLQRRGDRHTLVVVDAVFSMDGDIADVPAIAERCRRHGALLMVDEAHSFGVLGERGLGVQEHFDLASDAIDVKMGTLSKALAGTGGFVAGGRELVDYLRHAARGYMFSGALPAACAAASIAALDVLRDEPERVARLRTNAALWKEGLDRAGFDTLRSRTPIVPVVLPDESTTLEFAHHCRERGVFAVPVLYPAVPVRSPRLRTCVAASHSAEELQQALAVLCSVRRDLGIA